MSITDEQIKELTPEHRIVWHLHPGQPVEMGLHESPSGDLRTDVGDVVRYGDGLKSWATDCIVKVLPPKFLPKRGLVVGDQYGEAWAVHLGYTDLPWLTNAPGGWFSDKEVRELIEGEGWKVLDDLTKEEGDA